MTHTTKTAIVGGIIATLVLFALTPLTFAAVHSSPINDDDTPSLTLQKVVVNDNGGTEVASAWTLTADGPSGFSDSGPSVSSGASFDAGTYDLSESGPSGYSASAWVCEGGNQTDGDTVEIGLGESATCTITNTFVEPLAIAGEQTANAQATSVAIQWTTNHDATSRVVYDTVSHDPITDPAPNYGYAFSTAETDTPAGTNGVTLHSVTVSGLTPGTTYFFRSVSHGSPEVVSEELTATTGTAPPPPPCGCTPLSQTIVSDGTTRIGGGNAVPVATSSAWTASIPGATWIWQASSTVPNAVVAFEKSFTVSGTVLSAQLDIAADNSYKVFIDGVQVAADASANNFTLGTQDTYNLTANVTPGTHILRIEVKNNGVFGALNPAGLLYKFEVKTCPDTPSSSITITICNSGAIINSTIARSSTGGNSTGGSVGGHGGRGGDIDPAGSFNNGGASSGNGGNGGNASNGGLGGKVFTGNASSTAGTINVLNFTRIRVH